MRTRSKLVLLLAAGLVSPQGAFRVRAADEVPVLFWHGLDADHTPEGADPYDPVDFATQIRWLAGRGFHAITPDQLLDWIELDEPLPDRPVLISFDDGFRTVYDVAYPVLAHLGYRGVNFQITSKIGGTWGWPVRGYHCTWDQIRAMEEDGVILTESHTVSHPDLQTKPPEEVEYQLTESRAVIEAGIPGKQCRYLCYPFGRTSPEIEAQAAASGYRGSFTVSTYRRASRTDRVHNISRIYINPHYTLGQLAAFVDLPLDTPTATPAAGDLIVDDTDPGFDANGPWLPSSSVPGFHGERYLYAYPGDPPATATWSLPGIQLGIYEIYMSFPEHDYHSPHAQVTVHHALGETRWYVDQATTNQGAWVILQRCMLGSGIDEKVVLTCAGDGISVADAVFVRMVEPFRCRVSVQTEDTALAAWPALPGVQYSILATPDLLAEWEFIGEPVRGTAEGWCCAVQALPDTALFWRITAEDPDPIVNLWVP